MRVTVKIEVGEVRNRFGRAESPEIEPRFSLSHAASPAGDQLNAFDLCGLVRVY